MSRHWRSDPDLLGSAITAVVERAMDNKLMIMELLTVNDLWVVMNDGASIRRLLRARLTERVVALMRGVP